MRTVAVAAVFVVASCPLVAGEEVPGSRIPVVKERRYVMSGAVRPLLFWIKRNDLGLARIVWRNASDGSRGYELLVGTDPARAPGGINRWGFVSEEASGSDGAVLALMTGSQQTTFADEAAAAAKHGGDFQAFVSRVEGGTAEWRLSRLRTAQSLTVHDLARAIESLEQAPRAPAGQRAVSPATRPGFLLAVADLLEIAHQAAGRPDGRPTLEATRLQYVFGEQMYELRARSSERGSRPVRDGQAPVVTTSFESRNVSTGDRTHFHITAGTSGDLAGVPLEIEWQPRWWLRVRLALRE